MQFRFVFPFDPAIVSNHSRIVPYYKPTPPVRPWAGTLQFNPFSYHDNSIIMAKTKAKTADVKALSMIHLGLKK